MKLSELAKKPQLQKITITDEALVEKYGDELEFFIYDRQPLAPCDRRRTLRAVPLITVWPNDTWPSPATTTWPSFFTPMIVVPCQPGKSVSAIGASVGVLVPIWRAGPRATRGGGPRPY